MKPITYAQFRDAVQAAKERGCSPNRLILCKPIKDKSIKICGKEFIITSNPFLGSIDGIDIYLDDGCLPDRMFLLDSDAVFNHKFINKEFEHLYGKKPKPFLKPAMDKTMQKILREYAIIMKVYPTPLIPVFLDPRIIDAATKEIPLRNLIPKTDEWGRGKYKPTMWDKIKRIVRKL